MENLLTYILIKVPIHLAQKRHKSWTIEDLLVDSSNIDEVKGIKEKTLSINYH